MGVPGHHTLPVWTHIIISYRAFWIIHFTVNQHILKELPQKIMTALLSSHQKFLMLAKEDDLHWWRTYWKCHSETVSLRRLRNLDTRYSDICYVVWNYNWITFF
jgi:hypothetical protein